MVLDSRSATGLRKRNIPALQHISALHSDNGHSHSHSADDLVNAFKLSSTDPGSRVTLIGLGANVGLTVTKGVAGWLLNSASLIADAAHSLSDLLGDFVTLFCWRWSRHPPTQKYPYGLGKFETLGTTTVSLLLIGGAIGIGFHSFYLLVEFLQPVLATMHPGIPRDILASLSSSNLTETLSHVHSHEHTLDPNAAWFALIGIVAKEWLYRISKAVADKEKSGVLLANAIHHRSDAYTSMVAFLAIIGTWWFPWLPLDPIGGLVVATVILIQGIQLLRRALLDLMDASVSLHTLNSIRSALSPLLQSSTDGLRVLAFQDLRARRLGAKIVVDLSARVPATLTVQETSQIEDMVHTRLSRQRTDLLEVRLKFIPEEVTNGHAQ